MNAQAASRPLAIVVVIFVFGLGGSELMGVELTGIALPLGLSLFAIVIGIRIWARSNGNGMNPLLCSLSLGTTRTAIKEQ